MKRTRSQARLDGVVARMKHIRRPRQVSLPVGEDVVAYFAAHLVTSTEAWHRELGVLLGEGLANRAVFNMFRALALPRVDALYATPPLLPQPLPRGLVKAWLASRFPRVVSVPPDPSPLFFMRRTIRENGLMFAVISSMVITQFVEGFQRTLDAADTCGTLWLTMVSPILASEDKSDSDSDDANEAAISVTKPLTCGAVLVYMPTPMLRFFSTCVLSSDAPATLSCRIVIADILAERAKQK